MTLVFILTLIWLHFSTDFLLQNDKMALNKSKSIEWLALHSIVYAAPLFVFGVTFALVNGLSHFLIDYCTSKGTTKLHLAGQRHWFFVLIGFDQAVHLSILLTTFVWLR